MTTLKFDELESALLWVSGTVPFEHAAYASRATGKIYWVSEETEEEEDIPDDIEDGALYVAIPHKNDLDLGKSLVFEFADEHLPEDFNKVRSFFSQRGAYSKFKNFLEHRGLLDRWYEYEQAATEKALREWANEHGFELSDPTQK